MNIVLLLVRLVLVAVFLVAGLTKLADPRGFRSAAADFGVPSSLAVPVSVLLPIIEVAVAIGLLVPGWSRASATGALVLLLAFSTAIAINLGRGRQPNCHCFGQSHSGPIGHATLVRNGVLVGLAAIVVWYGPGDGLRSEWDSVTLESAVVLIAMLAVLALVAAQGWLLVNLLRQNGRILLRLEAVEGHLGVDPGIEPAAGLPVGSQAPEFALSDLDGHPAEVASLRGPAPVLVVVFTAPGCGPCHALLPELASYQRNHAQRLGMVMISHGSADQANAMASEHELSGVLADPTGATARAYRVRGTPAAVLINAQGHIASPLASGPQAVRQLIMDTLRPPLPLVPGHGRGPRGQHRPAPTLRAGDPVPEITLVNLQGHRQALGAFFNQPTVLLFWNPACGFCQKMLPDLHTWQVRLRKADSQLVVISRGTAQANRALGLQVPILLDPGFDTADRFGAQGTPNAVLISEHGTVASEVAVGADQILKLCRTQALQ